MTDEEVIEKRKIIKKYVRELDKQYLIKGLKPISEVFDFTVRRHTGEVCMSSNIWVSNGNILYKFLRVPKFVDVFDIDFIDVFLERVVFEGATEILHSSFKNVTTLKEVKFGDVKDIGQFAFCNTYLKNVVTNASTLEASCFYMCRLLEMVTLTSKHCVFIDTDAFCGCPSLESITVESERIELSGEEIADKEGILFDFSKVKYLEFENFNLRNTKRCYISSKNFKLQLSEENEKCILDTLGVVNVYTSYSKLGEHLYNIVV